MSDSILRTKSKEFAKEIPNVEKIELLPYHAMAKEKYQKLNIPYRLENVEGLDNEKLKMLQDLIDN